jgi:hypothetical protein
MDGYPEFRILLSILFSIFAAWLVFSMPIQSRLDRLSSLATALVVTCAFSLKGFVQIREGLAFLLIAAPLVAMFANGRHGLLVSGFATLAAVAFHAGAAVLAGTWVVALTLMTLRDQILASRIVHSTLLFLGVASGVGIGIFTIYHTAEIRYFLGSYGVNVHAKNISSVTKNLYWILNGIFSLKIRSDLIRALAGTQRFAFCYGSSIASFAIPLMYTVCVALVLSGFETPAMTSMMIRIFFTFTEIGVLIIALRGKLNFATAAITAFMLVDRLRVATEGN